MPAGAAWLLNRRIPARGRLAGDLRQILIGFLMLIVMLELWGLYMPAFRRLAWYVAPWGAIGISMTLTGLTSGQRTLWWLTFAAACALHLYSFLTPAKYLSDGHTAELYIPYSSQIEKGYNIRREWIFFVYYQQYSHHVEPDSLLFMEESMPAEGSKIIPSIVYENWNDSK